MKIACLGGGPAGLYFAISMKLRNAAHDVTVFERNKPDDTFGWGVVLSNETLQNLVANDPVSAAEIRGNFAYWDDIAVHYRGQKIVSTRPWLFRHRPQDSAAAAATTRPRAWRRSAFSDRSRQRQRACEIIRSRHRRRRAELKDPKRISPIISSRRLNSARTSSSGSAPIKNSTTPSRSSSKRPSTAGSGHTPISSMPIPRLSSSSARTRPGRNSVSATWARRRTAGSAKRSSRNISAAIA